MTTVAPRSVSHSIVGNAADPEVVDDLVAVERDVEIGSDQDPLAVEAVERCLQILQDGDLAHRFSA